MNGVIIVIIVFFKIVNVFLLPLVDQTTRETSQNVPSVSVLKLRPWCSNWVVFQHLIQHRNPKGFGIGGWGVCLSCLTVIIFICFLSQQSSERCLHGLLLAV